ncbi:MAG: LysR family transcriptional regulator [Pseudomonadota bacterium]
MALRTDWDEYRFFLALARTESVRGAAQALQVNPSTVTRRLEQLEQRLGVVLFSRASNGLQITTAGRAIVAQVDAAGEQLQQVDSRLEGQDQRLQGRIRLAVPDILATSFLLQDLAPFASEYPAVDLEFVPAYQNSPVGDGGADIAIRATDNPPEHLIGRPLARFALASYGSRDYLAAHTPGPEGGGMAWIDWADDGEVMGRYARLRQTYFPNATVHIRCDHIHMQYAAVRAGLGLAILPCFLGEEDETLVRLPDMPLLEGPGLWMLIHPDARNVRRLQLLMGVLREVFDRRGAQLLAGLQTN